MKKIIFTILILIVLVISISQLNFNKKIKKDDNVGEVRVVKEKNMNFVLDPGNTRNYKVLKEINIEEMELKLYEVEHLKTKCRLILALCDDENRAFSIGFKTYPYNDNGICHITEHSVLCGSRKYSVKDPFFSISQTTLATFMNAVTFNDATLYPIASANLDDYKNLTDVYMDSVLYPMFKENPNVLKQEGWHYEIDNRNSDLKITGVVYNEMKGDMSNPLSLLANYKLKDMFPDTPYAKNYGGDPESIVTLTQDEFTAFHDKYYHPSNAIIYLYGDLDMNERLEYLNREYLSKFEYQVIDYPKYQVDEEKIFDGEYFYNDETGLSDKGFLSYNFVYKDDRDPVRLYVARILNYLLFDKEGALVSDALKKQGYGESIGSQDGMIDDKGYVSIVAENVDTKKKDKFRKTVDDILLNIYENGIDEKQLQSAINNMYITVSEPTSGWSTKGLNILMKMMDSYFYGYGMDNSLAYRDAFNVIKNVDLKDKNNIFMQCFNDMYIKPRYKNMTVLTAKKGLQDEKDKEEKIRLKKLKDEFTANAKGTSLDSVIKDYKNLLSWMQEEDSEESINSLPKLSIDSIDKEVNQITYAMNDIYGKNVLYTEENTGDLVYMSVDFELPKKDDFNESDKYYLGLLANLLGSLDTDNYIYHELNTELDLYTGGFSSSIISSDDKTIFRCSIKATKDKIQEAYKLLYEIIYNTKFDDIERIGQKIKEMKNYANELIVEEGHGAVLRRALSKYSFASEMSDKVEYTGIAFNMFINDLAKNYSKRSENLMKAIAKARSKYLAYDKLFLDCCTGGENYEAYSKATKTFLQDVASRQLEIDTNDYSRLINSDAYKRQYTMEVFLVDANVNFISRAAMIGEKKGREDFDPKMSVLANILRYDYLHNKIRVEGGAYGSGIVVRRNGYLACYSYRDPKFKETDGVYKDIKYYTKAMDLSPDKLKDNIIGTMKTMDSYLLPKEKHIRNVEYYLADYSNDDLNKDRNAVLSTTLNDINRMKNMFDDIWDESEYCALANKSFEDEAKTSYKVVKKLEFN